MRQCKICKEEKELDLFRKRQTWFSHTCKACHSAKYVTGIPNSGRFQKGHKTWCEGKKIKIEKRKIPRYVKKGRITYSEKRTSVLAAQWALKVKERDDFKCQECGCENDLTSHHIISWKDNEKKRFELENGVTLCRSCHSRIERLIELSKGKNNFKGDK